METIKSDDKLLNEYIGLLGNILGKKCTFYTDLVDKYRKDRMDSDEACMMLINVRKKSVTKELIEKVAQETGRDVEESTRLIGEMLSSSCTSLMHSVEDPPNMKKLLMSKNTYCQLSNTAREKPEEFKKFVLMK